MGNSSGPTEEGKGKIEGAASGTKARRWVLVWLVPVIWLAIVGLAHLYRGGEWMALAVALFPAILVHKVTVFFDLNGNNFLPAIGLGLPLVMLGGFLMDWARVSLKMFFVSLAIGVVLAYGLVSISFFSEVHRVGLNRAYSRFDLDQPDRRVAWQVLCTSLGLYGSLPIALVWRAVQTLRKPRAIK